MANLLPTSVTPTGSWIASISFESKDNSHRLFTDSTSYKLLRYEGKPSEDQIKLDFYNYVESNNVKSKRIKIKDIELGQKGFCESHNKGH